MLQTCHPLIKTSYYFLFSLFLNLVFFYSLKSQSFYNDSVLSANAFTIYKKEIGPDLGLYNGREYVRNGQKAVGFPFFESDSLVNGTVMYDGKFYTNTLLYYDLVADLVVVNNYSSGETIALVPEKIDRFNILNHFFTRIIPGKENSPLTKPGFYEILYQDKIAVFAKRQKRLEASMKAEDLSKYIQYNDYFLKINNTFYKINGEREMLDLLSDKKNELKKYIKENKLSFRKKP